MWFKSEKVLLTTGVATGGHNLNAFDNALRAAGIADFNLIKVSSIVPRSVPVEVLACRGSLIEGHGILVPTIYEAVIDAGSHKGKISAAVGVGLPDDGSAGVIFVAGGNKTKAEVESELTEMIKEGMLELRGIADYSMIIESIETEVSLRPTCALAAALFADETLIHILSLAEGE